MAHRAQDVSDDPARGLGAGRLIKFRQRPARICILDPGNSWHGEYPLSHQLTVSSKQLSSIPAHCSLSFSELLEPLQLQLTPNYPDTLATPHVKYRGNAPAPYR